MSFFVTELPIDATGHRSYTDRQPLVIEVEVEYVYHVTGHRVLKLVQGFYLNDLREVWDDGRWVDVLGPARSLTDDEWRAIVGERMPSWYPPKHA